MNSSKKKRITDIPFVEKAEGKKIMESPSNIEDAPKIPVVIAGLSNVGKTSLVNRLKTGKFVDGETTATVGVRISTWTYKNAMNLQIYDLGGQAPFRPHWRPYIQLSRGLIFVIDASNENDLKEAAKWFWSVNENLTEETSCIALLLNKWDIPNHLTFEKIVDILELTKFTTQGRSFQIFQTSVKTGFNVSESLEWFIKKLTEAESKKTVTIRGVFLFRASGETIGHLLPSDAKEDTGILMGGLLDAIETFNRETSGPGDHLKLLQTENYSIVITEKNNFLCAVATNHGDSVVHTRTIAEGVMNMMSTLNQDIVAKDFQRLIKGYLLRYYSNDMKIFQEKTATV